MVRFALRLGGGSTSPGGSGSGGFLVGFDVTVPSLRLSDRVVGRLDVDSWSFGFWGTSTGGHAYTVCQILSVDRAYFGAGIGYLSLDDGSVTHSGIAAKLIAGVNVTTFMGFEANIHLGSGGPSYAGMIRFRF